MPTTTRRTRRRTTVRTAGTPQRLSMSMGPAISLAAGVAQSSSQKSVAVMKDSSQKEKKDLQGLNCRLANHLEKTRMLEAENKCLKDLLNKAKVEFNVDVIKMTFKEQLDDLKALLEDKDKELASVRSKNESLEEEVEDLIEQLRQVQSERDRQQNEIDELHDDVARRIGDSETSRRRTSELEKQLADWKSRYGILDGQMAELRANLQSETTQRLDLENRLQTLEDEIAFLNDIHVNEVKEYQAMLSKTQKLPNFQESWKAEIGTMVADLSAEYDAQLAQITSAMETRHLNELQKMKAGARPEMVSQVSSDNRRSRMDAGDMSGKMSEYESMIAAMRKKIQALENELSDTLKARDLDAEKYQSEITMLRAELEAMLKELQELMDAKLSLELEISAYRKLLEGEESRTSMSSFMSAGGGFRTDSENLLANALQSKVTMSRTTTGSVGITELENDGMFIQIEDLAKFPKGATNIKNWTLTQRLENGKTHTHTFSDGNVFASGKMVKVWGYKHGAGKSGIVSSVIEWAPMTTPSLITLTDSNGKESATVTIRANI